MVNLFRGDSDVSTAIQGDRTQKVGVVDSEYIVHLGLPTLGVGNKKQASTGLWFDNLQQQFA